MTVALMMGLFSTPHCLGMCWAIIGALTLSLPQEVRNSRPRLFLHVLAYNAGRIAIYTVAGAAMGSVGEALLTAISPRYGHAVLKGVAAVFMAGFGFYIAGWFPQFSSLEKIGSPLWRKVEPLGRRLLPVKSPLQALLLGAVWGWLPCGLVYSALIWTASSGGAWDGASYMLAFGIGTLPGVMTAGIITDLMIRLTRIPYARQAVGLLMIAMALGSLALGEGEGSYHELFHSYFGHHR